MSNIDITIEEGSTNVYADMGYADAAEMQRKSQLAAEIARSIQAKKLTQTAASELLGIDQSKISRITRGQFRGISESKMLELVAKLGHDVATQRRNAVPNVDSILQQLDGDRDLKEVRAAIADLIEHHLQALKGSIGYWEKAHFANAIASLAWNINSRNQQTTAWLRLCLANVEKALVPVNQRNETYTPRDKPLEALTHEQLIEDINSLRQMGC